MTDKLFSDLARGAYSGGTSYTIGDFVTYNGSSYACIADTTGNLPTNASYWALLASKGDTGSTGSTGAAGDAATIAVGTTTTLAPGESATVTNVGTSSAAVFDFGIPAGENGEGSGDVTGPASSTDTALARFNGAGGKTLQNSAVTLSATVLAPGVSDAVALGSTSLNWADLFLASGAVINIANSNWVATHTSGILTVGTGDLRVSSAGTNSASVVTVGGSQTLTGKTLTSPVINTPTGIVKGDVGLGNVDNTSDSTKNSATATLTNKRITKRLVTTTDDATAEIDCDSYDEYYLTAIANNTTISVTGTPTPGQTIFVGLKDAGVSKTLTWTSITGLGVTLPTATTANKQHIIGLKYIASAWRAIAVGVEA